MATAALKISMVSLSSAILAMNEILKKEKINVPAVSEPKSTSAEATILPVGGCEDGSSIGNALRCKLLYI